jgi:hypothetical protein
MGATRLQLRTRAKRRADRENSSFVADAEWNDYINEEVAALHNLLVLAYEDYALSSDDISVVSGTDTYALPTDFYKERGVEFVDTNYTYTLRQFRFRERNRFQNSAHSHTNDLEALRYQILGSNIRFVPVPESSGTVRLWYVPQATVLDDDADTVDFSVVNGWEAMIVAGAGAKALIKEQEDAGALMTEKQMMIDAINREAKQRATGDVKRIVDVDIPDYMYGLQP